MTILEDLKSGRLVVVPAAPEQPMLEAGEVALVDVLHGVDYFMPDDGMNRVLRAALSASPDHTTALLSLVEGMERERDETARQLSDPLAVHINMVRGTIAKPSIENIRHIYPEIAQGEFEARCALRTAEARALAAEAERDRLKVGREDLVSRAEVLRVLKRLGDQDADLALYGAEDNARAREYGEAAMTRARCAVELMPSSAGMSEAELAIAACARFLKEGETPAQRIERLHGEISGMMKTLAVYTDRALAAEAERDRAAENWQREKGEILSDYMTMTRAETERRKAAEAERDALREAVAAVTDATSSYLPPDGISAHECISRVIAATDNPKINAVMIGERNGTP